MSRSDTRGTMVASLTGLCLVAVLALIGVPEAASAQGATSARQNAIFFSGGAGGSSSSGGFLSRTSRTSRTSLNRAPLRDTSSPPERVPINVLSIADGTAGTIRPEPRQPRRRNIGGAIVPNGPVFHYLLPTGVYAAPYGRSYRRSAVGNYAGDALPSRTAGERAPAGRLPRVPSRQMDAPDRERGEQDSRTPSATDVPMIPPPTNPEKEIRIDLGDCVEVRLTTAGGIEWRNRVSITGLEAESVQDAARVIRETLAMGDPLVLEGLDGRFVVGPNQVQGFIVGPCASVTR